MAWSGPPPIDPSNIRPKLMLTVANRMMLDADWPYRAVTVEMASHGGEPERFRLLGANHPSAVAAVADGSLDVAMLNPSCYLDMAYRGVGDFAAPLPVATIAVLPHFDQLGFAVADRLGFTSLADIAAARYPLRVSVRGSLDAVTERSVDVVLRAYGFSLDDIRAWGGEVLHDQEMPNHPSRLGRVKDGGLDAIFEEATVLWADRVADAGMRFLPIDDEHMTALRAQGFRPAVLEQSRYPSLPGDVPTVDYSGWPIFTRVDASDELVTRFCAGLLAERASIPWDTGPATQDPMPLERMLIDSPSTPLDVPFHPAAERFWRENGLLG